MLIYRIAISLYNLLLLLAKPFNKKAALLVNGRSNSSSILQQFKRDNSRALAWFHCASLGEFEQARPVIEQLKKEQDIQIAVSFFSPSGYEVRKNYNLADVVFYLPSDSPAHAKQVLDALNPTLVFFVKYEIWIFYIREVVKRNISLYLLSATFRPSHIYFKWYGRHLKHALQCFDVIFTQDHDSLSLLKNNRIPNAVFSNDTRYDRVHASSLNPSSLPLIAAFKGNNKLLVLGSSYTAEEELARQALIRYADLKVVIAPHETAHERIAEITDRFREFNPVKYSEATEKNALSARVLIVDSVGLLSAIYQYGNLALVGGGFGQKGIHNTLEAVAFGMPVFIGPNNHERFPETGLLKANGILFSVASADDFNAQLHSFLSNEKKLSETAEWARMFIRNNTGATTVILNHIKHQ